MSASDLRDSGGLRDPHGGQRDPHVTLRDPHGALRDSPGAMEAVDGSASSKQRLSQKARARGLASINPKFTQEVSQHFCSLNVLSFIFLIIRIMNYKLEYHHFFFFLNASPF